MLFHHGMPVPVIQLHHETLKINRGQCTLQNLSNKSKHGYDILLCNASGYLSALPTDLEI